MHLILHMGMPKTGSTALQRNLADNRARLAERGVLYPRFWRLGHAHHVLMPLFLPPAAVWGRVREDRGSNPTEAALTQWELALEQARARRPETMVLSTEALFSSFEPRRLAFFSNLLKDAASRFTLVAYVREPAKFYSSILVERAKRTSRPRPAEAVSYRQPIEQLRDALGASVIVRVFDRAQLHKGDIASDFLLHVLGIELAGMPLVDGNVSFAPETAAVFQRFMEAKTSSCRWMVRDAERKIIGDLLQVERDVGRVATALRPEVAERVTYASKDILWLREAFGITFGGVNYDRLRDYAPRGEMRVRSLRDAFDFDETFFRRVLEAARSKDAELRRYLLEAVS